MNRRTFLIALSLSSALNAQPKKPFQSQSPSSVSYSVKDGTEILEITNVGFELTAKLLLRKTTQIKYEFDDVDIKATTTVEAWPVGVDVKQKPSYTVTVAGIDPRTVNHDVLVISRRLEEVDWWTVYRLANGARMFDTYTPLTSFSLRDSMDNRYAGLQLAEDEVKDPRLKVPNVVAVITYASADRVIREALVTCDDPKRAALLRSLGDSSPTLEYAAGALKLSIRQHEPPAATTTITVPITKDDLDFAKVQAPAGVHVAAWKR